MHDDAVTCNYRAYQRASIVRKYDVIQKSEKYI